MDLDAVMSALAEPTDFYSPSTGTLVVSYLMAGNTPRDVEVWPDVSPDVLGHCLEIVDSHAGPGEVPTVADCTDLLSGDPTIVDVADAEGLRALAARIADLGEGFVDGLAWAEGVREMRGWAERAIGSAEVPPDLGAARDRVLGRGDLVSCRLGVFATVRSDHEGNDLVELYPGLTPSSLVDVMRVSEREADGPVARTTIDAPRAVLGHPSATVTIGLDGRTGRLLGLLSSDGSGFEEMPGWHVGDAGAVVERLYADATRREVRSSALSGSDVLARARAVGLGRSVPTGGRGIGL